MEQRQSHGLHLSLAPSMYISLEALTMPLTQLIPWLEMHIEQNPLLALDPDRDGVASKESSSIESELDFEKERFEIFEELDEQFYESIFPEESRTLLDKVPKTSAPVEQRDLFAFLAAQAREAFSNPTILDQALELLTLMDDSGFLPDSTPNSSMLTTLQTFDPPGIAARSIQESLALQLERKSTSSQFALRIVKEFYNDLLHNRKTKLCKALQITKAFLDQIITNELACLSITPAASFSSTDTIPLIPDLFIIEESDGFRIEVNQSHLPFCKLEHRYDRSLFDKESRSYFTTKSKEAKILQESLKKRTLTLLRLGKFFLKKQRPFLQGKSKAPRPLTIEETAEALNLHPSTISRAVAEKVISTPRGMFSLKDFYRNANALPASLERGIARLIEEEDKSNPLSDIAIAENLKTLGLPCSRRTVTKYRQQLQLPTANFRKR